MTDQLEGQMSLFDRDSWFGKMSSEHSVATRGETSKPSSPKSSKSLNQTPPMCLCLVGGGYTKGCIYSEVGKWSIAWRVHDAQFWGCTQYLDGRMLTRGTPQRRKRIALVADFNGLAAPEILFERKGLQWHPAESREKGKGTSRTASESLGKAISFQERAGKPGGAKEY